MSEKGCGHHSKQPPFTLRGLQGAAGVLRLFSPCFCRLSSKGSLTALRELSGRPAGRYPKVAKGILSHHPLLHVWKS